MADIGVWPTSLELPAHHLLFDLLAHGLISDCEMEPTSMLSVTRVKTLAWRDFAAAVKATVPSPHNLMRRSLNLWQTMKHAKGQMQKAWLVELVRAGQVSCLHLARSYGRCCMIMCMEWN